MKCFIHSKIVSAGSQIIRRSRRLAGLLLAGVGMAGPAAADTVVINFDSVDASGGAVDATSYLATYGITLTNVSNPGTVAIYSDVVVSYVSASSSPNFLLQQVGGAPAESFTMDFSTPLQSLSFTRIENVTSNQVAEWTATAYSGSTPLSSESEPMGVGSFTPATYTFNGPDITSLTISADGDGVAGITSAPIDDLTLTTAVPEPSTYTALLGVAALGFAAVRRKWMAAQAVR